MRCNLGSIETNTATKVNGEDKTNNIPFDPHSTHSTSFEVGANNIAFSSGMPCGKGTNSQTGVGEVVYIADRKTQREEKPNKLYLQSMRPPLFKPILASLKNLQEHAGKSSAIMHIEKLLSSISVMEDKLEEDPLVEVFSALYDALAYKNNWKSYDKDQYERIHVILDKLLNRDINQKCIDKAILEMHSAGIDILPYSSEIIDDIEES